MKKKTVVLVMAVIAAFALVVQLYPNSGLAKPDKYSGDTVPLSKKSSKKNPAQQPVPVPAPIPEPVPAPAPAPEPSPNPFPEPAPAPEPAPSPGTIPSPTPETPAPAPSVPQQKPAVGLTKEVVGYYAEDWIGDTASLQSVYAYGSKMSGIASFSFQLKADGTFNGSAPASAVASIHKNGGKALALVHNYSNGSFNRDLIHAVLNDTALRSKTAASILSIVKSGGFDGVNIDFENISSADRTLFTAFVCEIAESLRNQGYLVTISVPAKTYDSTTGWGGAFDYKALGAAVDRVMLMTYDEHWFGGPPGPVASIGWVEQVVKYATSQIPADKLLLGLGMYGYDWDTVTGKTTRALPSKKALQVANQYGAVINWDRAAQVPYFYYNSNGVQHVVWFESHLSAAVKMNLVNRYNLAGIAVWRLGFEDEGFWEMIGNKFSVGL